MSFMEPEVDEFDYEFEKEEYSNYRPLKILITIAVITIAIVLIIGLNIADGWTK